MAVVGLGEKDPGERLTLDQERLTLDHFLATDRTDAAAPYNSPTATKMPSFDRSRRGGRGDMSLVPRGPECEGPFGGGHRRARERLTLDQPPATAKPALQPPTAVPRLQKYHHPVGLDRGYRVICLLCMCGRHGSRGYRIRAFEHILFSRRLISQLFLTGNSCTRPTFWTTLPDLPRQQQK